MKLYKQKRGKKWQLSFNVNNQRCRIAVSESKTITNTAARRIEALISCGGVLDADLREWIKEIPDRLRAKLISFGLVNRQWSETQITKTLAEHLEDYLAYLRTKNSKPKYVTQAEKSIEKTLTKCDFKVFSEIDGNKVAGYWADLRDNETVGQRTYNSHIRFMKMFTRWLIKKRRLIGFDPMEGYNTIKQTVYRKKRRAFTADEERRLLETTLKSSEHHNLSGYERALVYRLALCTGMRADEIRKLQALHFDFEANTVRVEATSKGKRTDNLIMTKDVAADMMAYLADKEPHDKAFRFPAEDETAKMIRRDEAEAGIEYRDAAGRDLDFHSLRHTFCTNLALAGVHPAVVQKMARHSDIKITMKYYTHVLHESEVAAIGALENMTNVCPNPATMRTTVDKSGQRNSDTKTKTAIAS